jgi:hypothetical protein
MAAELSISSSSSESGSAREASRSAPLRGCPYVGFAFFGVGAGADDASAVRFLNCRFAALRTWRATFSSAKIVLRDSWEDLEMSDALRDSQFGWVYG